MPPLLIEIVSGYASPWSDTVDLDVIRVGRGAECEVRLHPHKDTLSGSRVHAELRRHDNEVDVACLHQNGVTILPQHGEERFLEKDQEVTVAGAFDLVIGHDGPCISVQPFEDALPGTINLGDSRRRRPMSQPVARVSEEVVTAAKTGRRLGLIAGLVSVLIVIAGGWWMWYSHGEVQSIREERSADFDRILDEQSALRAALDEPTQTAALRDALQKAADSVYLVGVEHSDGTFDPQGTAWVAARGTLVTNAHVAQRLESARREGSKLVGRRAGDTDNTATISIDEIHPAFDPWLELLAQQLVRTGSGAASANLIAIADVATLRTADTTVAPIPLAEGEVQIGDAIGYVGFPMEGLSGLPTLQMINGSVTAVTDPFFARTSSEDGLLVHLNLLVTGGASGSPVLNEDGEVIGIVSSASVADLGDAAGDAPRIPLGMVYAQHATLVRELLDDRASAAQAAREPRWRSRLEETFLSPGQRLDIRTNELASQVDLRTSIDEETTFELGSGPRGVTLAGGAHYAILATAEDWTNLTMAVGSGGAAEAWGTSDRGVVAVVLAGEAQTRNVDVIIRAGDKRGSTIRMRVVRMEPRTTS